MQRIAIIFDNTLRPETTGLYCRRALGELVRAGRLAEIEHFLPSELDRIPEGRFDLFLYVDDGLDWEIADHLRPAAWWAIDTHLEFARCLDKAQHADFTFAAQRDGAERLRREGIAKATWLPLACDPDLHGRQDVPPQYDVCFIGHLFPERERLLDLIRRKYPNSFVGRRYFREMAATYSASRAVFNRSVNGDVNMRVFEGLCSGSLVVTNDLPANGQTELFEDGRHLATYGSDEELLERLGYYLSHDAERERVAAAGRTEVLARHTYRQRMETVLSAVAEFPTARRVNGVPTAVRGAVATKPREYFEFDRPDVLELVPPTAQRILDIGCGSGRLGAALKVRQACEVVGIELTPSAAAAARERLDDVQIGNIEEGAIEFEAGRFDCVICADVLEHLREPADVLRTIRRWLAPDGTLVVSIPNVRHHTVVQSLLAGNWNYETAGLLDSDHVRFFTRREFEKLLFRAGFAIDELRMVPGEGFAEWVQQGRPRQVRVGALQVRAASPDEAAEFFAYQYLVRSTVQPIPDHGLTSIVIVTHNQLAYTQACIDSIRLRTDEPYELVFVDNASTDGTVDYLRSLDNAIVIANDTNRGFPAAANQGMSAARGANILLLNNDTLVTTGWLRRMLDVLHSDERIGLVGPVSNRVSGEQQIDAGYGHLSELDGWAWDRQRGLLGDSQIGGAVSETDRLVGFCLLIKRCVIDAIGLLDERFGIGCFEDDDFCRRAIGAGYKAAIAQASFVHHFGSVTFRASGLEFRDLLEENRRRFVEKWGGNGQLHATSVVQVEHPQLSLGQPRPKLTVTGGGAEGLLLQTNSIKLSACFIVRDNEHTIRPCLESIRPWVDEIVVVDTGSQDRTPQVCEELGARVFHWAWRDNFAAARNVSLDHARGEWLFWMDSDDTIPADCGRRLRELALGNHADHVLGYVVQVHCPGRDPHDVTVVDHVKLIRNRPDLRFEFRIHEQILPAIRRAGGDVAWTDLHVVHSGADQSDEGRQRKLLRDFRLLRLELAERPEHPFVLFNLGMTLSDAGQHGQATTYLTRCVQVSRPLESHLRKAYALLVWSLVHSGRRADAWAMCVQGLDHFPADKELLFRRAMLEHESGRLQESAGTYRRVIEERTARHFTSVDAELAGIKARHNLAVVYEDMGRSSAAEAEWRRILDVRSDYEPAIRALNQSGGRLRGTDFAVPTAAKDHRRMIGTSDAHSGLSQGP